MKDGYWGAILLFFLVCLMVMSGFYLNAFSWNVEYLEQIDSLQRVTREDSTLIQKLREDAGKTMYMMERGSQGKDTVYFQDKSGNKYIIQFHKQ